MDYLELKSMVTSGKKKAYFLYAQDEQLIFEVRDILRKKVLKAFSFSFYFSSCYLSYSLKQLRQTGLPSLSRNLSSRALSPHTEQVSERNKRARSGSSNTGFE